VIRIAVSTAELRRLIKAHQPDWLKRAREQTKALEASLAALEFPELWNEIKEVYIKIQGGDWGGKCAYCEKWLEADRIGHDVEHFRPKAKVSRWDIPEWFQQELDAAGIEVKQPASGHEPGYPLLAYHVLNYATACKQCNSVLKRNLFPIKGKRRSDAKEPAKLTSEGAFLIYPIGSIDDDPEDLIEFEGVSPQAKAAAGFDRLRAMVTIEIFRLADWRERKPLIQDRLEWIEKLLWALRQRDRGGPPNDVSNAKKAIAQLTSPTFRHANCLRSFKRLYDCNPGEAEKLYESEMKKYLNSVSSKKGSSSTKPARIHR
jgi:hypothetical protein